MSKQQMDRRLVASLALMLGVLLGLGMLVGLRGQTVAAPQRAAGLRDVVINEVAWMGTTASTSDEWIELYNNTDATIDLTGWTLVAQDGTPSITLNGTIPARGYFLLERTDDTTVSDIPADQIYTGALGNNPGAESLTLYDNSSQVIDTANGDGGAWPAGDSSTKHTMERIGSTAADADANWDDNDGIIRRGLDANSNPINGTPTARNSVASPEADLIIRKIGPSAVQAGEEITYTIAFSNVGNLDATGVIITDVLPAFVSYTAQTSSYAVTEPTPGTRVWTVGPVGVASGTLSFQVMGQVDGGAAGELTNAVTITTAATETVTANNYDACTTTVGVSGTVEVRITALHYYGYDSTYDEAVQLMNLGTATADLGGWYLADDPTDTGGATFPAGATLAPDASIWCARSAMSFADEFGFKPDYEMDDTDPIVPELAGSWPGYTNTGDECVLFDSGPPPQPADVLVYGTGSSTTGWSGAAVQPWAPSTAFAKEGQILYRKLDQASGRPVPDTNTAADWAQDPADHIDGRRFQYPGWDLDEFFQTARVTETANLVVAVAPDNAYEVIKGYVDGATVSIFIEGYTFENADLIDAVVSRAQAGVTVRVLLEGEKVTDQERWFCQRLHAAGGTAYFFHNDDAADIHDRYRFQHAKFMIVDGQTLIVGSENFNYSGLPADDKSNGTWGRRGAFLITDAPGVVARAQLIFDRDLDTAHKDIVAWSSTHPRYGDPTPGFAPTYVVSDWVTYTVRFSQPLTLHDAFAFEVVQSPETSLRDIDSLLGLVGRAGAGDTVLVELLYEREHWGPTASNPTDDPNPRLEAYIDAARRGAAVRILLNGSLDCGSVDENTAARDYVNGLARSEGLALEARLGDPAGRGIHNKMVLVQIGGNGFVHVGSINGSEMSCKGNRELALQVQSNAAYDYLVEVFTLDWNLATPPLYLPLIVRDYRPLCHLVISELLYNPGGLDDGHEWVEIYNPTGLTMDLSGYKIGDAANPGDYEGMYQFPAGSTIGPWGIIIVAQQAVDFEADWGVKPDYEIPLDPGRADPAVQNMSVYAAWGSGGTFAFGNAGDEAVLLGPDDTPVDVLVYGTGSYPGVNPHPGVADQDHSLERRPANRDTDDCAVDFHDRTPPDPGSVSLVP